MIKKLFAALALIICLPVCFGFSRPLTIGAQATMTGKDNISFVVSTDLSTLKSYNSLTAEQKSIATNLLSQTLSNVSADFRAGMLAKLAAQNIAVSEVKDDFSTELKTEKENQVQTFVATLSSAKVIQAFCQTTLPSPTTQKSLFYTTTTRDISAVINAFYAYAQTLAAEGQKLKADLLQSAIPLSAATEISQIAVLFCYATPSHRISSNADEMIYEKGYFYHQFKMPPQGQQVTSKFVSIKLERTEVWLGAVLCCAFAFVAVSMLVVRLKKPKQKKQDDGSEKQL